MEKEQGKEVGRWGKVEKERGNTLMSGVDFVIAAWRVVALVWILRGVRNLNQKRQKH